MNTRVYMREEKNNNTRKNRRSHRRYDITSSRWIISLLGTVSVFAIILLGSNMHAFANSKENQPLNKYYTSVRVEAGDTLWDIAEEYKSSSESTRSYVREISKLNKIHADKIKAGDYIVISYYSTDKK